jgi:hypothetical protein
MLMALFLRLFQLRTDLLKTAPPLFQLFMEAGILLPQLLGALCLFQLRTCLLKTAPPLFQLFMEAGILLPQLLSVLDQGRNPSIQVLEDFK